MRRIKGASSYLRNQTLTNLAKAVACILVFGVVLFAVMFHSILNLQIDLIDWAGTVFLLVPAVASYYFLRKYHLFRGGWEGEKQVAKVLASSLSDDYYSINDLYLHGGGGDIDHVVLAPAGVFVLETKNWSGTVNCQGDDWQRPGKRHFSGSPSSQVKRNASKIKHIIDSSPNLRGYNVLVSGIVVLTNRRANVHVNNPTVPILKLPQLSEYIVAHGGTKRFTGEQLEAIGREIVKQKA